MLAPIAVLTFDGLIGSVLAISCTAFSVLGISWAGEERLNAVTGCDRVSPGCQNCWMFDLVEDRLQNMNAKYEGNGTDVTIHEEVIEKPLSWRKPRLIFVDSMGDLFHPGVPDWVIRDMFEVMNEADHHVYQILTKRSQRLARIGPTLPWHDHIWMGVSVESDEVYTADGDRPTDRIDDLRRSMAEVMWISAEPLIGPLHNLNLTGIDWVVVGGESGDLDEVREMKLDWARDIINQCRSAGVAVHVKQLGKIWAHENGYSGKGDDPEEWPEDLRIREQPQIFPNQPQPVAEPIS